MQDQKIEKIAAFAVNITKMLVIIYLGFVEVFKIGKLLREKLNAEFDISRKWASQNYSILKKRLAERKVAGVIENYQAFYLRNKFDRIYGIHTIIFFIPFLCERRLHLCT